MQKVSRRTVLKTASTAAVVVQPQAEMPRLRKAGPAARRVPKEVEHEADLCVVGGGLAGTCGAITAARAGLKVALIQDRPVLGGNASSEVRLWILGATAHMGNNNRWAREGGVVGEVMVENMHRNPEGNPLMMDALLLEKVYEEPNIRLMLNTAVDEVEKRDPDTIAGVRGYCAQNETSYVVRAPLFLDSSGDGVLGFLAGAAFRMGAEGKDEFGEGFAPERAYGELLGHSLYFYSRDAGKPVKFTAPSFALKDIRKIPRYGNLKTSLNGCQLWWLEWGGRLDTVHDTEEIKWELWKVAYGVWDYFKNSGRFPEAENLTLEWIGMIPGKRESRRFEGAVMLTQQDMIGQRRHEDAVSHGGWAIDLHPADGVFSDLPSCTQWHAKGVYQIPYRAMFSRNIRNLMLAGRIVSVSHVAFGSTRVMGTCSTGGQAVALASVLCRKYGVLPADIAQPRYMKELQRELIKAGQYIPGVALEDPADLAQHAQITASSEYVLERLKEGGAPLRLETARAMALPVAAGRMPAVTFTVDAAKATTLEVELRGSSKLGNFTPDVALAKRTFELPMGKGQAVKADFGTVIAEAQYVFVCLGKNPAVSVETSEDRVTGVISLAHSRTQEPPEGSGIETFEIWNPSRRPGGRNHAITVEPGLAGFGARSVTNGFTRPWRRSNAWVARADDERPRLTLKWAQAQTISKILLFFDADYDHPMESVLMGHPEREMPFCVSGYRVLDGAGQVLHEVKDNHQPRNEVRLQKAVTTDTLVVEVVKTHGAPVAVFEVRCYA